MTRHDALLKVAMVLGVDVDYGRNSETAYQCRVLIAQLEALGLIKFEEPKAPQPHQELAAALQSVAVQLDRADVVQTRNGAIGTVTPTSALSLIDAIERAGLKIVRA